MPLFLEPVTALHNGYVKLSSPGAQSRWTPSLLRETYAGMEGNLGPRLTQVLDWAIAQGYFVETKSLTPAFSLRGDTTNPPPRRFSVYMDGTVYVQIGVTRFAGGQDERDRLIDALNRIPIFRLDKADTGTGRNSKGKLPDLTDAELQQFFAVCDDFCKKG